MNNLNIFDYTQLAEASYANFWKDNQLITNSEGVEQKLQPDKDGKGSKFSKTQAEEFVKDWSVLAQYRDRGGDDFDPGHLLPNGETGFSATLFKNNGTDEYVFACKGTLGLTDISTDAGDLVHDGLAIYQIVDMYNFWQQITAPKGESYKVRVLEEVGLLEAGTFDEASLQAQGCVIDSNIVLATHPGIHYKRVMRFVEKDSSAIYTKDDERATGLGINPEKVTVVGHSLGGHLASAFSRLFPELVDACLMINGAGYADFGTSGVGAENIPLRPTFLSCFSH